MYSNVFLITLGLCLLFTTSASAQIIKNNGVIINGDVVAPLDFDINQAYTQLMYAYSAYCPEAQLKTWNCFFCNYNASTKGFVLNTVLENTVTNTFGYIGAKGSVVVIAFRGTTDLVNWITDFDYAHSSPYANVPNAFVHTGFYDAYNTIKTKLRTALSALITTTKATQVIVTGHSLGAALSTICAVDIAADVKVPISVYNFGSPRVGNKVFTDYFHTLIPVVYRVVNQADIVPHLPLEAMGYHHVAQEVWWNSATSYKVCDMSGEDPKCSDSVIKRSIPDHLDYMQISVEQGGC